MSSENVPSLGDQSFEGLKRANQHGAEFWSARDLQTQLGYSQWRSFEKAVTKSSDAINDDFNKIGAGFGSPQVSKRRH